MIPFILGFIGGFAFAVLLLTIFIVVKAGSLRSREEEAWVENIGCTMHEMSDEECGMPQTLREVHRLEEEAFRRKKEAESRKTAQ